MTGWGLLMATADAMEVNPYAMAYFVPTKPLARSTL